MQKVGCYLKVDHHSQQTHTKTQSSGHQSFLQC